MVLRVVVLAMLLTLLGRLWQLQVLNGDDYARAASDNRVREVVEPAPRGEVVDARGVPLVRNRTALVVSVRRSTLLALPEDGRAVLERLGALLGREPDAIAAEVTPCGGGVEPPCWSGSPYTPVPVAELDPADPAAQATVLAVEERREDFAGVTVEPRAVRDHPQGTLAAHLLGHVGPVASEEVGTEAYAGVRPDALVGRAGVEASHEVSLRGRDGVQTLLVDRVGTVTGTSGRTAPVAGETLVLSVDARVQRLAETALQHGLERARGLRARGTGAPLVADSGAVVVLEARTGRVVAMASAPSYDPAVFTGGLSPAQYADLVDESRGAPLVPRAWQGQYAPASTFKVVSTVAAATDYPLDGRYDCPGVFGPTGQRNFDSAALGRVDLRQALVKSCDTVFYRFAYEQWLRDGGNDPVESPRDPVLAAAEGFGLGERTGVDLPGERRGVVPDRAWRRAVWEDAKGERCRRAEDPARTPAQQRLDRDYCTDGWRLRGGDATNTAIGQGDLLVTPLQLATAYAAIANGGRLMEPHVGRALVSPTGAVREIEPVVRGTVPATPELLAFLRDALAGVTQPGGTAAGAFAGSPVAVAGKTGTGEVAGQQDTSWFASFAPAAAPELVVVAMVSQGGTGGTVAAPVVREVYDGVYGPGGTGSPVDAVPQRRPDGTFGL